MFALARDFGRAARVYEQSRAWREAAQLYEQAGDFLAAARCHEGAGEVLRAGAAYERGGRPDAALRIYQTGGAYDAMADCLVRNGQPYDAARLYQKLGDVQREAELLVAVGPGDPCHLPAVKRLAHIYERYGRLDHASQLLVTALRSSAAAAKEWDLYHQLIRIFERLNQHAHAQRVRDAMREQGGPASGTTSPPAAPIEEVEIDVDVEFAPDRWSSDAYGFLKATPMFADLSLEDMKELYRVADQITFRPGATIIEGGEESRGLFVVVHGQVEVYDSKGARLLNTLGPGAHLGEIALVQNAPASARVVAKGTVQALFISRGSFEQFVYTHERAALSIYRVFCVNLAERVRALSRG
jgi:tetratricopeptide (TPR) repeat protein